MDPFYKIDLVLPSLLLCNQINTAVKIVEAWSNGAKDPDVGLVSKGVSNVSQQFREHGVSSRELKQEFKENHHMGRSLTVCLEQTDS